MSTALLVEGIGTGSVELTQPLPDQNFSPVNTQTPSADSSEHPERSDFIPALHHIKTAYLDNTGPTGIATGEWLNDNAGRIQSIANNLLLLPESDLRVLEAGIENEVARLSTSLGAIRIMERHEAAGSTAEEKEQPLFFSQPKYRRPTDQGANEDIESYLTRVEEWKIWRNNELARYSWEACERLWVIERILQEKGYIEQASPTGNRTDAIDDHLLEANLRGLTMKGLEQGSPLLSSTIAQLNNLPQEKRLALLALVRRDVRIEDEIENMTIEQLKAIRLTLARKIEAEIIIATSDETGEEKITKARDSLMVAAQQAELSHGIAEPLKAVTTRTIDGLTDMHRIMIAARLLHLLPKQGGTLNYDAILDQTIRQAVHPDWHIANGRNLALNAYTPAEIANAYNHLAIMIRALDTPETDEIGGHRTPAMLRALGKFSFSRA